MFSANSEGACPECKGLGLIYADLAFMAAVASQCEACDGKRFTDEVLTYRLRGQNISDVLAMSVIEHNLDVIARADWVIDLGPGAGHDGGRVVFQGPPLALIEAPGSLTGQHLRRRLAG